MAIIFNRTLRLCNEFDYGNTNCNLLQASLLRQLWPVLDQDMQRVRMSLSYVAIEQHIIDIPVSLIVPLTVVLLTVAVLGGITGGVLVCYCWNKTQKKPHPSSPWLNLYEDVFKTTQKKN